MSVQSPSHLINYLPPIYHEEQFLGQFLLAFEKILLGINDNQEFLQDELDDKVKFERKGLEELIAITSIFFDPIGNEFQPLEKRQRTPKEFLSWLASWVALSLRDDWEEEAQRRFISRIVSLYKQRGTKAGMVEMLKTYTGMGVEVEDEFPSAIQIGVVSTVGKDTSISEGLPHYFKVKIILENLDDLRFERKRQIAQAIIEQEKPAHTYYHLDVEVPSTIQVGVRERATIGVNTLLGNIPQDSSKQQ
jgi:phage tail-like protein